MRAGIVIPLVGLVIVACGVDPSDDGTEGTTIPTTSTTTTSTTTTSTTIGTTTTSEDRMDSESPVVRAAIRDLATRLDIPEGDIEVVDVRDVQWPDGSLGCPEEGKVYTQAIVEGTQVILGANGRIYDYHAGDDDMPFLCPSDEKDGGYDFVPPPGFDE
jgi:hypothetical protein